MKTFVCKQGSEAWLRARLGKPTASNFDKLITGSKWVPTKGETRRGYAILLLTELILDMPLSGVTVAAMEHGNAYEDVARAEYEMNTGQDVTECGFVTDDAMTYGASPDSFVGEEGMLQVKCPFKPENHVAYLMDPDSLRFQYFTQCQGELFVTGRKWNDLVSYFRALPMVKVRIEPHPEFQEKLGVAVRSFCAEFSDLAQRAFDLGYLKELPNMTGWVQDGDIMTREKAAVENDPMWLTDADVDAHLRSIGFEV